MEHYIDQSRQSQSLEFWLLKRAHLSLFILVRTSPKKTNGQTGVCVKFLLLFELYKINGTPAIIW